MTTDLFVTVALEPGLSLLPAPMDSPAARAFLLAIALQETTLSHRRQVQGPARSYFQFERAGVKGVLKHQRSSQQLQAACAALDLKPTVPVIHAAIEYSDVLAVCCARLLLWTLPMPLPLRDDEAGAWRQYLDTWEPGRPRVDAWAANFSQAWAVVAGEGLSTRALPTSLVAGANTAE